MVYIPTHTIIYYPCMVYLPHIWLISMVNVGKYTIHGCNGQQTVCWFFFRVEKLLFAPCGIRCEASTKFAFIACGATMAWRRGVVTRWAPTIYKWSYNHYNPYKWSYFTLLTTGRSTACRFMRKRWSWEKGDFEAVTFPNSKSSWRII